MSEMKPHPHIHIDPHITQVMHTRHTRTYTHTYTQTAVNCLCKVPFITKSRSGGQILNFAKKSYYTLWILWIWFEFLKNRNKLANAAVWTVFVMVYAHPVGMQLRLLFYHTSSRLHWWLTLWWSSFNIDEKYCLQIMSWIFIQKKIE